MITIAGNSPRAIKQFKHDLSLSYGIKDMGSLQWLLGIGIKRVREKRMISFSQTIYIQKIIECFGMEEAKPLSVLISPGHSLTKSQSPSDPKAIEEMRCIPYREAIGSLMYAVVRTQPDIAYAVTYLARFMANPGHAHWEGMKCVIRYLKGTKDAKLILWKGGTLSWEELNYQIHSRMQGYSDANKNSQQHRHEISHYVFCIDGGAISWNSRKQALVSLSTTESEYVAMMHTTKEALWIRMFLGEILCPLTKLILLYCDNQSAIAVVKNDQYHACTKHIDICYHFICKLVAHNIVEIRYCPTNQMITDIFIKALPVKNFEALQELLGVHLD